MANYTNNLHLSYLNQNQIAKDVVINQNMQIVDSAMHLKAVDQSATPPSSPGEGEIYLVAGSSASGLWAGYENNIAIFQNQSWYFIPPAKFMVCDLLYKYGRMFFNGYSWVPADSMIKIGDYKISAHTADHDNWMICDGRAVSRSKYSQLFGMLGTKFGAGDGSTTFNVPRIAQNALFQNTFVFFGLV